MHRNEEVFAIPLWINGRASLRLTPEFHEVRNPVTGQVVRKAPLCGPVDFDDALRSARTGLDAWHRLGDAGRRRALASLGEALAGLSEHFASLVAEETGENQVQAADEIADAVSHLRDPALLQVSGVAVVSGGSKPFSEMVGQMVSALAGGATLIVCPALGAPTASFALAELSGRCDFPPGAINVLYPGGEVLSGLKPADDLVLLV